MEGGGNSSSDDKGQNGTPKLKQCSVEGSTVYVTKEGCTASLSSFNSGAEQTYTCRDGRVSVLGMSGKTVTINGVTFTCK